MMSLYATYDDGISFGWDIVSLGDTDHDGHGDMVVSGSAMNLGVLYGVGV